jgi:hypothetical protein
MYALNVQSALVTRFSARSELPVPGLYAHVVFI